MRLRLSVLLVSAAWCHAEPVRAEPAPDESCDHYVAREEREFLAEHPGATPAELERYLAGERRECVVEGTTDSGRAEDYETTTRSGAATSEAVPQSSTRVERRDIEERMPRSSPDALRYEPGVYVQQTAQSQGSAYIRGVTGQQTVMLFDGIRLNNSLYRQGPNQYFFTVDSHSVASIDVTRGSGSVLYGSDALGGVIEAHPIEPALAEGLHGLRLSPRTTLRAGTADDEIGGRFELDGQIGDRLGFIGGVGYRDVGLLESGGQIHDSVSKVYSGGERELVPRYAADGRTQLGTGFREATEDARLVYRLGEDTRAVLAIYDYRQFDAPRTDKCPPPFAPAGECLTYEEQFRALGYLALDTDLGRFARGARVGLSLQRQRERRRMDRPASIVDPQYGRDTVLTPGLTLRARTSPFRLWKRASAAIAYGIDAYRDDVSSVAWYEVHTERNDMLVYDSRGQYVEGSSYTWGGAFANLETTMWERLHARAGVRGTRIVAFSPEEPGSETSEIDRGWTSFVGGGGLAWDALPGLTITVNLDQGFRAPNLDDLTSRQQAGPGFQFENPDLVPERSVTLESGVELQRGPLRLAAWGYRMTIDDAMARRVATPEDCPKESQDCRGSWFAYQLMNLEGTAEVVGFEGLAWTRLPLGFSARATVAYARGDGPNPASRPEGSATDWEERVPLSRVPPLNGTVELLWRAPAVGVYLGAGLRWAAKQDRLAPQDEGDARIPLGGTPGYAVLDLRAGYRLGRRLGLALVAENLGDAAYRTHGSSVNGPGRSLMLSAELGL
ncbi:MAG: TonB-dependent receptor [Deltaproteobacteria bacterium]|nr:TonB-dependent receptor [Deltaproteobacteria bacterium]